MSYATNDYGETVKSPCLAVVAITFLAKESLSKGECRADLIEDMGNLVDSLHDNGFHKAAHSLDNFIIKLCQECKVVA